MATGDAAWRQFSVLCNDLRDAKTAKSASDAIASLQVFLSDAHHRQLVHRWRSWGFLLHRLLHVIRTEMRACLELNSKRKRKTSASSTMAPLQYWHYLRTELETAHVTADGPMLHLDANGRDCIRQLFTFSVAVIKCQKPVAFGQNLEVLVEKEAWLTVEVLVQYRVYCVVLDYEEWRSIQERTLRSFSPDLDSGRLTGDVQTATTRARVLRLLLRNSPFDLSSVSTSVILQITAWFEAVNVEHKADLLLSISSTLMETLTDMMRTNSGAIAPLLLRRGVVVLEFICKSNRDRKNGLRGAPAEFVMQFLDLYRHNVTTESEMCSLSPNELLCEMKKLVHVAMGPGEISLVMTQLNSARERRLGNALGIDDQEIRRLACTADIIFHHDRLVSEQIQSATGDPTKYGTLPDQFNAGSKHPRFTTADLAWEVVTEHIFESPRTETQYVSASSVSPASQRQTQSAAYLPSSSRASQFRRTDAKQTNDSGSWLLLLLSILRRHGDYYMSNRIGDLIMVMQKLGDMLVVKEMGKLQSLTLHVLIQMASLSARFRDEFNDHLSEHWANVWQNLLRPDLPYARITEGLGLTRGQAGDAVLTLLNCCISFELVSMQSIAASSMYLWELPAFRNSAPYGPVSRGDTMRPYARTSMASICMLMSLLRSVQLPVEAGTTTAVPQTHRAFGTDDNALDNQLESLQIRLLRSVFDHFRMQVFQRNSMVATGSSANSVTRIDWQTEVSPIVYASVIRSLFGQTSSKMDTQETIFTPELLRKFSARSEKECEGWIAGEEMNGFGVAFCMHENGLEYLSMAFPPSTGLMTSAFSPAIRVAMDNIVDPGELCWFDGASSYERNLDDRFERLAVPPGLLGNLPPHPDIFMSSSFCSKPHVVCVQSLSKSKEQALGKEVVNLFSELLSQISSSLPSDGCSPSKGLQVLANSLDVGLVLAVLYADEAANCSAGMARSCVRVLPLLKQYFDIVADYLRPSVIKQAQHSQAMSENILHILRGFHTMILATQGQDTLARCHHPSAYPIDMRIPSEVDPAIATIVNTLEVSLACFSGTSTEAMVQLSPRPRSRFRSIQSKSSWTSSSSHASQPQLQSQPTQKEYDAMDDGDEKDTPRDRPASRVLQECTGLWCIRLILLLKKDRGLSAVQNSLEDLQLDPDFVLAVAVLLCGVTSHDGLEAFVKLIDHAAEEGMCEHRNLSAARDGSCQASIFLSQVLSALAIAGFVYEKRKCEHGESPPTLLVECAKKYLDAMAGAGSKTNLRMARRAELQCLEVFFRLDTHEFNAFEEACMTRLTDCDASVRVIASRGLQSIYYMYPEGGESIFRHFYTEMRALLDVPLEKVSANVEQTPGNSEVLLQSAGQGVVNPRLSMDLCLSVLLSLYVSACSSQMVLPVALNACVELASMDASPYAVGTPSLTSTCLHAISVFYGYADISDLLDDHFCSLWHEFIVTSCRPARADDEDSTAWMKGNLVDPLPDGKLLLQQFPLSALLNEEVDLAARRLNFATKIDMILSVGVLHSFVYGKHSVVKTSRFGFVNDLATYFFDKQSNEQEHDIFVGEIGEQLTTDLFAFSFILLVYPDPMLNELGNRMLEKAEQQAQVHVLTLSHLGHIVGKMARFIAWGIVGGMNDNRCTPGELWTNALKALKEKYSEFDWRLMNVADLLSDFNVLLLRAELFSPRAVYAVECFKAFAVEICDTVAESFILQRLLLSICFQAIKHLSTKNERRIGSALSRLVRELCERFLKKADMFGQYVGFVVQEISGILLDSSEKPQGFFDVTSFGVESQKSLSLNADDRVQLERVISAVCIELGGGLGKYTQDIELVPNSISESLDKLNGLIIGTQQTVWSEASETNDGATGRQNQAKNQIEAFIQKMRARGMKFYDPLPPSSLLSKNPTEDRRHVQVHAQASMGSSADIQSSALTTSIRTLRDSTLSTRGLYEKLTHTLLYLSSASTFGKNTYTRDRDTASLANALGEIGALDASEYELSPAEQEGELSRLHRLHFHRGALQETKTAFSLAMHESLLVYLSSIVFEERMAGKGTSSMLQQALRTLKSVLNLDEGVAALARCKDGELKSFLCPFDASSPSNWSSTSLISTRRKPKTALRRCTELWTSAEKIGFEAWVCSLASFLTEECPDPVLKVCSTLASLRVDMAVFLLPYALESILRKAEWKGKRDSGSDAMEPDDIDHFTRLSEAINQGIIFVLTGVESGKSSVRGGNRVGQYRSQETNPCQLPQVVQLIVHSINFLRETRKARFVGRSGKGEQQLPTRKGPRRSSGTEPSISKRFHGNELAYGCMVDVDLLVVAKAAIRVKMPYSAMQYVEMWLEKENGGKITPLSSLTNDEVANTLRDILVDAHGFSSNDDGIYGVNDGRTLQSQLVKFNRESQYAKTLPLYDVSLQFSNANMYDGGMVDCDPPRVLEGMLASLRSLGYNSLLEGYLQSIQLDRRSMYSDPGSPSLQALQHKFELAWKNMQWEAVLPGLSTIGNDRYGIKESIANCLSYQQMIFEGLRAIAHENFAHLQSAMATAKDQIMHSVRLSLHSFESTKDSYSALVRLRAVREIEEIAAHIGKTCCAIENDVVSVGNMTEQNGVGSSQVEAIGVAQISPIAQPLLAQWQKRHDQIKNDFDKAESLLALEEVLLQVSKSSGNKQALIKLHLDLASVSRKSERTAVAYRSLLKLEQLNQSGMLCISEKMQWKIQKGKLLWKQQEFQSAIWTGKEVCSELSTYLHDSSLSVDKAIPLQLLLVNILTTTGKWIASQRCESSQIVLEHYFQKATKIVTSIEAEAVSVKARDAAKAHFVLADFMAAMNQQVSSRVTSREWLAGKEVVQARHEELQELQTMEQGMQNENRAHIFALSKEVAHDMDERSKVEASVNHFLIGALHSYGKGLCLSPQAELAMVFRVLSLWFNNRGKAEINRVVIEEIIDVVPSFKFIPLSYQIISRISSRPADADTFETALRKLVMKLSVEHPHHALVQIVALKNSGEVEGKGALQFRTNVGDAKAEGAKLYLAELMKTEQRKLLESLDFIANAYIQLALFNTSEYHGHKKKIPLSKVPINAMASGRSGVIAFDQCLRVHARRGDAAVMPAVLTSNIRPQVDMDYSNVVRMYSFEPLFSITDSGIHRPKIIYCYGSDGRRYKQLVKGQDDTRQDLVIEQVFETMNQFLLEEKETRKRKLRLRTYRVVPLSPIAGVLEWVENTIPWGSYLVSRTSKMLSAHERYHPFEWKHAECRQYLKNAAEKLPAFLEIQANFTPVFHHFFLERFPDAAVWYHRRLAYVQSAAVTSIVGYILGIGDRHSQNILIHEETGELVHIDFGVVFDQGMALYTPETVPFRLTRDMVDGMGIAGVDGVFSRCCEVTLQLLRKKSASLVTILEVFVHDPLYRWTLSPLKALKIQEGGERNSVKFATHSRNSRRHAAVAAACHYETQPVTELQEEHGSTDAAARALIRVKQKLEGYEDPNGSALSIEGQVKQLLSAAQDSHNLCKLFPGWAPWL